MIVFHSGFSREPLRDLAPELAGARCGQFLLLEAMGYLLPLGRAAQQERKVSLGAVTQAPLGNLEGWVPWLEGRGFDLCF